MVVTSPFTSRLAQRVVGRLPLEACSLRSVEVAPGVVVAPPRPPIHDPAELDRITGAADTTSIADQMRRLAGTVEFGPTLALELPPMWFVDGNFSRGRRRVEMNHDRERLLVRRTRSLPRVHGAAFVSSSYGNKYFGHHLTDDLPTALLGPEFGDVTYVNPPGAMTEQLHRYRRVTDQEHPVVWTGHATGCWVFHDQHLNDSKVARLRRLREKVSAGLAGPSQRQGTRRVFLGRGASGAARSPRNERALIDALAADGWDILDPERATLDELQASITSARVVAGVEGSQLAHAVLGLPDGAALMLLLPPDYFNLLFKDLTDRLDLQLGFHIGSACEDGWTVDVDAVRRLVERFHDAP